jgi:hypothetical protein
VCTLVLGGSQNSSPWRSNSCLGSQWCSAIRTWCLDPIPPGTCFYCFLLDTSFLGRWRNEFLAASFFLFLSFDLESRLKTCIWYQFWIPFKMNDGCFVSVKSQ